MAHCHRRAVDEHAETIFVIGVFHVGQDHEGYGLRADSAGDRQRRRDRLYNRYTNSRVTRSSVSRAASTARRSEAPARVTYTSPSAFGTAVRSTMTSAPS
jgi:hypothetical protein